MSFLLSWHDSSTSSYASSAAAVTLWPMNRFIVTRPFPSAGGASAGRSFVLLSSSDSLSWQLSTHAPTDVLLAQQLITVK